MIGPLTTSDDEELDMIVDFFYRFNENAMAAYSMAERTRKELCCAYGGDQRFEVVFPLAFSTPRFIFKREKMVIRPSAIALDRPSARYLLTQISIYQSDRIYLGDRLASIVTEQFQFYPLHIGILCGVKEQSAPLLRLEHIRALVSLGVDVGIAIIMGMEKQWGIK